MPIQNNRFRLADVNFTPVVFQGVTRTPIKRDLSAFGESLNKIDERKEKVDQQTAAVMSAINNVKLDSSENAWKKDYVNRIKNEINYYVKSGDYSSALETATRLAGEAVNSPELIGRQRYYEERQKWLEELKARHTRKEIDSDTYNRAVAENPYSYLDTYDNLGKITGGISWNPAFNPVNDIDLTQVTRELKALVTQSGKSTSTKYGTTASYVDSEGNVTKDQSKAKAYFSVTSGGRSASSEVGITAEKWENAYNAWVSAHPEALAQFEQKRQNSIWSYNQYINKSNDLSISEEERNLAKQTADAIKATYTDKDGALLSAENYAKKLVNPMFDVMAYKITSSDTEESSTLLDKDRLSRVAVAEAYKTAYGLNDLDADLMAQGAPMEVVLANAATNRANLDREAQKFASTYMDAAVNGPKVPLLFGNSSTNSGKKQ